MIRTQVYLPEDLHRELKVLANIRRTNFSSLIREGARVVVDRTWKKKKTKDWGKGFIGAGSRGGPKDLSSRIDYYLYGGGSKWAKKP